MKAHATSDPSQRLFQVACRMQQLLQREFGTTIDVRRTLHDTRYARDVLLVCEARPGNDLFSLAMHFRREQAALNEGQAAGPPATESSAVAPPRLKKPGQTATNTASSTTTTSQAFSSTFGSLFGTDADYALAPQLLAQAKRPAWYSPARWLGR